VLKLVAGFARMLKRFKYGIDCGVRNFQSLMHQIGDWSHRFRSEAIDAAAEDKNTYRKG